MDPPDINLILSLQLLIARAAQKDSLMWWEDESLTPSGKYMLERLFFVNGDMMGRQLALEAAKVRYQAAFSDFNHGVLHLFHLDQTGDVDLNLQGVSLAAIQIPIEAVHSVDDLRQLLLELVDSPMKYQVVGERSNSRLGIKMVDMTSQHDLLQIVKTLAWASLEGEPGKPIFPYIQPTL